jgi:D-glutamate cyclase
MMSAVVADPWAALEAVAATDQGRGSVALADACPGGPRRAVDLLTSGARPHLVILTGFAIPAPDGGWHAETDGPLGAVQLAECAVALGWPVRILTDVPCAGPVRAVVPPDVPVDIADLPTMTTQHACPDLIDRYDTLGVTHVVSIERVGPSPDGAPRNMRGEDISAATACLEHVVEAGPWAVVAVGDGGNEIGMGVVPQGVVERHVPAGARVRCTVSADALVIAGTSNWGAAAIVAGLSLRLGRRDLLAGLADGRGRQLIDRLVAAGGVDGVTRLPTPSVDGLEWPRYQAVVDELIATVDAERA